MRKDLLLLTTELSQFLWNKELKQIGHVASLGLWDSRI